MNHYKVSLTFKRDFVVSVKAKTPAQAITAAKKQIGKKGIKIRPKDSIRQVENAIERI